MPVSPSPRDVAARALLRAANAAQNLKPSDVRTWAWFAGAFAVLAAAIVAKLVGIPAEKIARWGAPLILVALTVYLALRFAVPRERLLGHFSTRLYTRAKDKHIDTLLSASSAAPLDGYLQKSYTKWHIAGLAEALHKARRVYRGRR